MQDVQCDIFGKKVVPCQSQLTDSQLFILHRLYLSSKVHTMSSLEQDMLSIISRNTIQKTFKIFEERGFIKPLKSRAGICGNKSRSISDLRCRFYGLTPEGEREYELITQTRKVKTPQEVLKQNKRHNPNG